ncbi:hypothetical protein J6V85_00910 [Candidatus Saccharibacteria bacterium]|nr:hypothetical protein [Candidatus Saccharibacteria bacterium]
MAQAKKKQATRTAKKQTRSTKTTQRQGQARAKQCRRTQCSDRDRNHIYIVTAMGMITAILLCANAIMMMV